MRKFVKIKGDYPDSKHNVNNFKAKLKIAIKIQLVSYNFKVSKKIDVIKAHFFCLLKVYSINKSVNSIILTLKKQH